MIMNGRGKFEDCTIERTKGCGVVVSTGGEPLLRGCRIVKSRDEAVKVFKRGHGLTLTLTLTLIGCQGFQKGSW